MISEEHEELVSLAECFIRRKFEENNFIEYKDGVMPLKSARPISIDGHIPDLHFVDIRAQMSIIVDAKTPKDIDNRHTYQQIKSYSKYKIEDSNYKLILALSVDFSFAGRAESIFRYLKNNGELNRDHLETMVIDKMALLDL